MKWLEEQTDYEYAGVSVNVEGVIWVRSWIDCFTCGAAGVICDEVGVCVGFFTNLLLKTFNNFYDKSGKMKSRECSKSFCC